MFTRFTGRRAKAAWLTCLLFVTLALAACGGAAESVSEKETASSETEEVAQASAGSEEQTQESQEEVQEVQESQEAATAEEEAEATNEEAAAEETEATDNENLLAPGQELASSGPATCRTVTPDNDPIAAVLQPNELITPVSDSDWTKGPADAPITVIEYGDFQ